MNYNKIYEDFNKRFGHEKEYAYFVGKPIEFFSCRGITAGCCVSVGGTIVLSRRNDDRIIVQFSDNDDFINCSKTELENNKDKKICGFFLEAEKYGVNIGGAEILLHYTSEISHQYRQLLMSAMPSFCANVPQKRELAALFDDYGENILAAYARENTLSVIGGGDVNYLPFSDNAVKVILCYAECGGKYELTGNAKIAETALSALSDGDYEKFGAALNRYTDGLTKKENCSRSARRLHEISMRTDGAYGSGLTSDGGIFAVADNARVDFYMRRVSEEYRKFFGSAPKFYVTRSENSGALG